MPTSPSPTGAPPTPLPKFPKFNKIRPATAAARNSLTDETSSSSTANTAARPQGDVAEDRPPLLLKKTRVGLPPEVCGPWEGKVASQAGLSGFVITSPSQNHVPKFPRDVDIVHTYTDGRWGVHEYSRHPQLYIEEMTHLACIPRSSCPPDIPDILYVTLTAEEHWAEDAGIAVRGLGLIRGEVRDQLREAAASALAWVDSMDMKDDRTHRYGLFLAMLLRQVVDRMCYLPAVPTRAMAVAAHIQRLSLELWGLKTFLTVVLPRMESPQDYRYSILDVVGGFLREGAVTQTWHRVGLPYWVLQPLTHSLVVWNVVDEAALPYDLSHIQCDPPILHRAGAFIGVSNLTGNWISSMVLSVSKHVAGSHLSSLKLGGIPDIPMGEPSSSKRPRLEERPISTTHLKMRPAQLVGGEEKLSRRQRRRKDEASAARADLGGCSTQTTRGDIPHPARHLLLSPFLEIPDIWVDAIRAVGSVPQTSHSALYFYPPPFLLDTVASKETLPKGCIHPERARDDTKVNRYLHNLIRIRDFCRARLFDISLDNRPLTIGEWRAALWGEYLPQTSVRAGGQGSDARRAKRRLGERNEIGALFHKIAHMDSYDEHAAVAFEDLDVDLASIAAKPSVRLSLLWESHEINFRAELLALDALLVQKATWMEINRWEREMAISGVWGPPTSAATVAARTTHEDRVFCWHAPPQDGWESCREQLRSFANVLTRWPGCPEVVIQGATRPLHEDQFREVQQRAVVFYVQTFVSQYSRLPIPPVMFTPEQ
ncbi:hypothetical protein LXA43DRAFT_1104268 [Ganoderma leucocontextum]|nr:hypothetical protein LXA43DRAFT_1104268 [Ganoderma leucocontextum]